MKKARGTLMEIADDMLLALGFLFLVRTLLSLLA